MITCAVDAASFVKETESTAGAIGGGSHEALFTEQPVRTATATPSATDQGIPDLPVNLRHRTCCVTMCLWNLVFYLVEHVAERLFGPWSFTG